MRDLETRMAAWRAEMSAALAGREEDVAELESHLRDHCAALMRRGVAPEAAWEESVRRLGEVHGIAREFERVRSPWWPRSWTLRGILVMLFAGEAALLLAIAGEFSANLRAPRLTPLLATHVIVITTGYLTAFCAGLTGGVALLKAWRRGLGGRERRELRDFIFRLTCASCGLVPIGIVLGMAWAAEHRGVAWGWEREEMGALFVFLSAVLLLVAQMRVKISDHLRFMLAVLGGATVAFGMFGVRAVTPAVPIGWLWLAFVASSAAVVLLRPKPEMEVERRPQAG